MKIKFNDSISTLNDGSYAKGQVVEVSDTLGKEFIRTNVAEEIKDVKEIKKDK